MNKISDIELINYDLPHSLFTYFLDITSAKKVGILTILPTECLSQQLESDPDKAQAGLSDLPVLEQAIEDGDEHFDNNDFASASASNLTNRSV